MAWLSSTSAPVVGQFFGLLACDLRIRNSGQRHTQRVAARQSVTGLDRSSVSPTAAISFRAMGSIPSCDLDHGAGVSQRATMVGCTSQREPG